MHPIIYIVRTLALLATIFCGLLYWAYWGLLFPKDQDKTHK